ncbi:MAG: DUF3256 family protein [Bacteroides sp.]
MNKSVFIHFLLALGFFSFSSVQAQLAKTVFVQMPDSLLPLLTAVNRADCIDFLESQMKAQVDNRFGQKSEMTALGKDYLCLQLSPQTTWQMKLLPASDSTKVICVVSSACAPVCDSRIQFYTTDWKELPASDFLKLPVMNDFIIAPDAADADAFGHALQKADMLLLKADLCKTDEGLTFTLTTPEYMEKETAEKLKPFLRRSLHYRWQANQFSPVP